MTDRTVRILMHGVTGRMGTNQHLVRSIIALRNDGGLTLDDGTRLMPEPVLAGRNEAKLSELAAEHGVEHWTTDVDAALADPSIEIFFDAATTQLRPAFLTKAIAAGKHIYCEKPVAESLDDALAVARAAKSAGVCAGVVQDKLFLPGIRKLRGLVDSGFFGRILSIRGDFGYWVFPGDDVPAQRPSWNYRKAEGGGIILDMLPHWRYVLDHVIAPVEAVFCLGANHVPQRWDEAGDAYDADADDAAYAVMRLAGGAVAQINSSWCTRVYRDDLVMFHVDGTEGSAAAGLHRCIAQANAATQRPVWNPDEPQTLDFREPWTEVDEGVSYPNGFRAQWEDFLRHVYEGRPFPHDLLDGARGVQLADAGYASWQEQRMIELDPLTI